LHYAKHHDQEKTGAQTMHGSIVSRQARGTRAGKQGFLHSGGGAMFAEHVPMGSEILGALRAPKGQRLKGALKGMAGSAAGNLAGASAGLLASKILEHTVFHGNAPDWLAPALIAGGGTVVAPWLVHHLTKRGSALTGQDHPLTAERSPTNFGAPDTGGPQASGGLTEPSSGRMRAGMNLQPGEPRHHEPEKFASEREHQLRMGAQVEKEHRPSIAFLRKHPDAPLKQITRHIASDHVDREDEKYYTHLKAMEKKYATAGLVGGGIRRPFPATSASGSVKVAISADPADAGENPRQSSASGEFAQLRHQFGVRMGIPNRPPGISTLRTTPARMRHWNGTPNSADAAGEHSKPKGDLEIAEPMVEPARSAASHY
jgi:hypothetical protein